MSIFYDRITGLCKQRGETLNSFARKVGIPSGSVTAWKGGTIPRAKNLDKIAGFFGVSVDYLLGNDMVENHECTQCGLRFNPDDRADVEKHNVLHTAWQRAKEYFGVCYSSIEFDDIRYRALNKIRNENLSVEQKCSEWEEAFKAYFSRSLNACAYNLAHVRLEEYIAMLLNQEHFKKMIGDDAVYSKLVDKYGTKPGMDDGKTFYAVTQKATVPEDDGSSLEFDTFLKAYKRLSPAKQSLVQSLVQELSSAGGQADDPQG